MKALRVGAGMSQAELADAIGMARESIGQMERGKAVIELRTALAIKQVTEDQFVGYRQPSVIQRHVDEVLAAIAQRGTVSLDDMRELRIASGDWLPAGGGELAAVLLGGVVDLAKRWREAEDGTRERLNLSRELRIAWDLWRLIPKSIV